MAAPAKPGGESTTTRYELTVRDGPVRSRRAWRSRHPDRAAWITVGVAAALFTVAIAGGAVDMPERHGLAIGVWSLVGVAALTIRPPPFRPPRAFLPLLAGLGLLTGLTALSLAWTPSAERTLEELARVVGFAGLPAIFLVAADRRFWQPVSAAALLAGILICALAVFAALAPEGFGEIAPHERLTYPFGYSNALAAWSAMTLAMGLAWSVQARSRTTRSLALAAMPVAGTALLLTYSRTGLIVALAGLLLVIALSDKRRRAVAHGAAVVVLTAVVGALVAELIELGSGQARNLLPAALVILLGCAAAKPLVRRTSRGRFRHSGRARPRSPGWVLPAVTGFVLLSLAGHALLGGGGQARSPESDVGERLLSLDSDRPAEWGAALEAFADAPLWGLGAGTYAYYWLSSGEREIAVQDAHSLYLEQLAELGAGGLLAVVLVVGGALWLALAPLRAGVRDPAAVAMPAAVACYAAFAAVDWLWESTAVTVLALGCALAAGAYVKTGRLRPRRDAPTVGRARRASGARRVAIGALASVIVLLQLPSLIGGVSIESSRRALQQGDGAAAADRASTAATAMPWSATPYAQRAAAKLVAGEPRGALADAEEAARREAPEYRHWLLISQIQGHLGNVPEALAALARARSLGYRPSTSPAPTG